MVAFTLGFQGGASAALTGATGRPTGCEYQDNVENGALADKLAIAHQATLHFAGIVIRIRR
ncbi:hypothetical protein [Streptomyces sp. NPDC021608]|uniref:hypothetical protein n=1 Tax=Streptomyces sp. NPDC021608 TaxID=3154903 RepID=UPI0033D3421D